MKCHISWMWLFELKALDDLSRHQWMFNLMSGSLQPLKGREVSNPNICSWKASYRRMRNWLWQASSMGVIFNSCFLLILVVIRPTTLNFYFGGWLFLNCISGQLCWQMAVTALWYPQLLPDSALWEFGSMWMLLYIENNVNMKRKWSQMQARYIVTCKCLYSTLKSNIT